MRIFKIYSPSNVQIHNPVLTVIAMLYITPLGLTDLNRTFDYVVLVLIPVFSGKVICLICCVYNSKHR